MRRISVHLRKLEEHQLLDALSPSRAFLNAGGSTPPVDRYQEQIDRLQARFDLLAGVPSKVGS